MKLLLIAFIFIVSFSGCTYFNSPQLEESEQQKCVSSGGNWKEFGCTSADKCTEKKSDDDLPICFPLITPGCDCGPDKCWDGESCVDNS